MGGGLRMTPIVFIHGIKGSHLAQTYDDSFDVVWSGAQKAFESIWDLQLNDSGEVDRDPRDLITVMRVEAVAYGEVLGRLRSKLPDVPVYIFRYDWRLDNKATAARLGEFLDVLRKKTNSQQFRFVTHSMGGLVLSAFLNLDPARNLQRVERAVMTVPPFWGAPEVMRALVVGDGRRFGIGSSEAFRKIARTFPSAYQLVPGYPQAWKHPKPDADIWNVQDWQARVAFDQRDAYDYGSRDELMGTHLKRAKEFHERDLLDFETLDPADLSRFLVLYGVGENTLQTVKVLPTNRGRDVQWFFDFEGSRYTKDGDGTVPARSARRYGKLRALRVQLDKQSQWWLPSTWDDKTKLMLAGFHGAFLALDKVQGVVLDWLTGKDPREDWLHCIQR
jgi:pimeloyl-ACP methyl ester carboxylesterase